MAEKMVYLAVAPCGCPHGIETEDGFDAGEQVAKWIRRGSVVERVPLEEALHRVVFDCPHEPRCLRVVGPMGGR